MEGAAELSEAAAILGILTLLLLVAVVWMEYGQSPARRDAIGPGEQSRFLPRLRSVRQPRWRHPRAPETVTLEDMRRPAGGPRPPAADVYADHDACAADARPRPYAGAARCSCFLGQGPEFQEPGSLFLVRTAHCRAAVQLILRHEETGYETVCPAGGVAGCGPSAQKVGQWVCGSGSSRSGSFLNQSVAFYFVPVVSTSVPSPSPGRWMAWILKEILKELRGNENQQGVLLARARLGWSVHFRCLAGHKARSGVRWRRLRRWSQR